MDYSSNEKVIALRNKLMRQLENTGFNITEQDAQDEIEFALLEYYKCRHFTPSEENPFEDIYSGIIVKMAISSISKRGAEGETYHSEGGIQRTYEKGGEYPLSLLQRIIPLAKGAD